MVMLKPSLHATRDRHALSGAGVLDNFMSCTPYIKSYEGL